MEIELRFNTGKRDLVAVIKRGAVKAVVVSDLVDGEKFRKDNGLKKVDKQIPPQIDVTDAATGKKVTQLQSGESAPVCYWVGGDYVCW